LYWGEHWVHQTENLALGTAQCVEDAEGCLSAHGLANAGASHLNGLYSLLTDGRDGSAIPTPYPCDPYVGESNAFGQAALLGTGFAFIGAAGAAEFGTGADLIGGGVAAGAENGVAVADAGSVEGAVTSLSRGRSPGVYMVPSTHELDALFDELSHGGSPVTSSYPGQIVKLQDGTTVGIRNLSKSGGPAIDVKLPNGNLLKVHVTQ
jgi:hypothetical protein